MNQSCIRSGVSSEKLQRSASRPADGASPLEKGKATNAGSWSARTLESCIGVPINYHLKPITRTQLAQMWVSKYYPNKYLDIQGDDAPRPKKDAAPAS
jgi:hypothetical protein